MRYKSSFIFARLLIQINPIDIVNVRTTHVCGRRPQTVNKVFLAKAMNRSEQDGLGIVVNM